METWQREVGTQTFFPISGQSPAFQSNGAEWWLGFGTTINRNVSTRSDKCIRNVFGTGAAKVALCFALLQFDTQVFRASKFSEQAAKKSEARSAWALCACLRILSTLARFVSLVVVVAERKSQTLRRRNKSQGVWKRLFVGV
jgi:hypothetical protein